MKINPIRSEVPIWGTGYKRGDNVTWKHQMVLIEYDMDLTSMQMASD